MSLRKQKTCSSNFVVSKDKWENFMNIMERGQPPTGETDLIIQLVGVYSLPEFWLKLQESGAVDDWGFEAKMSDGLISNGKLNPRELTEEEKKELEVKKKPPPKINKKDLEAIRAEEERIAREAKEKEDREKEFEEKLSKMEEDEKFYYLKEMPTKEAWISWKEKNVVTINKQGIKLIEFEEDVNENKGAILELSFKPPPDSNDKKKMPKPKGLSPEEIKPVEAIAWIDLTHFYSTPGLKEDSLRCKVLLKSSYEKRIDDLETKIGKKILNPYDPKIVEMIKENEEENKDYVEKSETYIYLRLYLSQPINPILPDIPLPEIYDLIKKDEETSKSYGVDEIEKDLLKQFKIAIAAIAKNYDECMGQSRKGILIRREKGNTLSKTEREEKDNNVNKFIETFNNSGRANLLKEKLKKFIVKIVREKYNKKNTSVKGVNKDKRDQFYSELYAYLTDYVDKATQEYVSLKKDEIHEYILTSYEQSKREISNYTVRKNREPEDKRLLRLSKENELLDNYSKALTYYKARLNLQQNRSTWINYAKIAKKLDNLTEVENAIVKAITIDSDVEDLNLILIFVGILYLKGNIKYAINFMQLFIIKRGMKNTGYIFNAFLAFLYREEVMLIKSNKEKEMSIKANEQKENNDMEDNNKENKEEDNNNNNNNNNDNKEQKIDNKITTAPGVNNDQNNKDNKEDNNVNKVENNSKEINVKDGTSKNKDSTNKIKLLFKKYLDAAKLFKILSLPEDELKPEPEPEEEVPVEEKEKKEKEKQDKTKEKSKNPEVPAEEGENLKKGNPKLHPDYKPPYLNPQQIDSIWFETINLFNSYEMYEITEKMLAFVNEETKESENFKISSAKITYFRKNYEKVIEECSLIIEKLPHSYESYLFKGHSYYYLKKYEECEDSYIKAIRFKPQDINFDIEMLTKLGMVYIEKEKWYDAKVIFKQILQEDYELSFAWRFLGFALTKLGEFEEAQKALSQGNLLDVENPIIWAYLTIFCLSSNKKFQAIECFNELNKINFCDKILFKEIAEMFLLNNNYLFAANIYIKLKENDPSDGENYLRIADILYNNFDNRQKEAINILKEGIEHVVEEKFIIEIKDKLNEFQEKEVNKISGNSDVNVDDVEFNINNDSKIKGHESFLEEDELNNEENKGEENKEVDKMEENKEVDKKEENKELEQGEKDKEIDQKEESKKLEQKGENKGVEQKEENKNEANKEDEKQEMK